MGGNYFFQLALYRIIWLFQLHACIILTKVKAKSILVLWRIKNKQDLIPQIAYCQVGGREILSYHV